VTTLWAATNDVMKRIGPGETVDLAIIAGPGDRGADREGKLVAGSRVDLTKSGIGVAVRSGGRPTSTSVRAKASGRLCSAPS
jgi:molybdate transport system substrate-binding protein